MDQEYHVSGMVYTGTVHKGTAYKETVYKGTEVLHLPPKGTAAIAVHCPRGDARAMSRMRAATTLSPQATVSSTHGPEVPRSMRALAGSRTGAPSPRRPRYQSASPGATK